MRSRLVTLLVLLLALAVPLQGLTAGVRPLQADETMHTVAVAGEAATPCHGHDAAGADGDNADCGCCAVCGSAALPIVAALAARNDLRCSTVAAPPAAVIAFVTEGPERPPRS
jgi:hypothetical protein